MDRLTEVNNGIVVPKLTANCKSHQYHCEDCDCEVMDCGFLRDALNRFCEYENTGLTPEICANYKKFEDEAISKNVTFSRIIELIKAEAEGRLIVLPCKVGDELWFEKDGVLHCETIDRIIIDQTDEDETPFCSVYTMSVSCLFEDIGRLAWITRAAAEAALKEAQQG